MEFEKENLTINENLENLEINQPEKKRGVKKGSKRGKYKKNLSVNDNINLSEKNNIDYEELKIDDSLKDGENKINISEKNNLITGYLLLLVIDLFIPSLLAFLFKKRGIKKEDLKLTQNEIKDLGPLADEVAKELTGKISPLTLFVLSISGVYLSKIK